MCDLGLKDREKQKENGGGIIWRRIKGDKAPKKQKEKIVFFALHRLLDLGIRFVGPTPTPILFLAVSPMLLFLAHARTRRSHN